MDKGRAPSPHDDFLAALASVSAQSPRGYAGNEVVPIPSSSVEIYEPRLPAVNPSAEIQSIPFVEGDIDRQDTKRLWLGVAIGSTLLGVVVGVGINNLSGDSTNTKLRAEVAVPVVHHKKPQPAVPTASQNAPLSNGVFLPNPAATPSPVQPTTTVPEVQSLTFRVATMNVLGNSHTTKQGEEPAMRSGAARMAMEVNFIESTQIEVGGFQEDQLVQQKAFLENVGDKYGLFPGLNPDIESSIFWNKDEWKLIKGFYYKSPYFNGHDQKMPVAILEDRQTSTRALFVSFHNPADTKLFHNQGKYRTEATKIQERVSKDFDEKFGLPQVWLGDANERGDYSCAMTASGLFKDASGGSNGPDLTCDPPKNARIDHILVAHAESSNYTVHNSPLVQSASDHLFLTDDITIPVHNSAPNSLTTPAAVQ